MRVENYGKNFSFRPARLARPSSVEELRRVVSRARRLRVMGSAHSWSTGIVTQDVLVSLDELRRVVAIDQGALRARVQAGIKLEHLIVELERAGFALANLGSIAKQSLAGAISTGTHGSGIAFRCLADQVQALTLVDATGELRRVERGHPDFDAIVVGLGCFGVVCEFEISIVPTFQMHAITDTASFDEVIARLDEYVQGYDHFKLWWLVPGDRVIVFLNRRTHEPRNDSDALRWFKDEFLSVAVYRSLLFAQKFERKRLVPATNRVLGREVGRRFERICKSHVGFMTPKPPVHREAEWAFDYRDAKDLLRAYRALFLASGHTYNFIQEIRFSRADDFWLSPAYRRDSIWLSLYNIDSRKNWREQLDGMEAFGQAHGGRPHWGKESAFDVSYLERQYPMLGAFRERVAEYDPEGKFRNGWVSDLLGARP